MNFSQYACFAFNRVQETTRAKTSGRKIAAFLLIIHTNIVHCVHITHGI